jgi:hypothetical protein
MYFFTFIFNVLYYGFRDLFKRERWKFRKHHLGKFEIRHKYGMFHEKVFVPYMLRWIIQTPFGGVRLQKICASDRERHLHDHPFDFVTFRLWSDAGKMGGGYVEETPLSWPFKDREEWTKAGMETVKKHYPTWSVGFRRATDLHRLHLLWLEVISGKREIAQWTLFCHGPNLRDWGFQTESGWVQWEVYEKAHGLYEANNP